MFIGGAFFVDMCWTEPVDSLARIKKSTHFSPERSNDGRIRNAGNMV